MKEYKPVPTRIRVVQSAVQTDYYPQYKPFWFLGWQDFNLDLGPFDNEFGTLSHAKLLIDIYLKEQKDDWDHKYNRTISYIDYP